MICRLINTLHDNAIIALISLQLSNNPPAALTLSLSLQLNDQHSRVIRIQVGRQFLALHELGDGGLDLGDV